MSRFKQNPVHQFTAEFNYIKQKRKIEPKNNDNNYNMRMNISQNFISIAVQHIKLLGFCLTMCEQ